MDVTALGSEQAYIGGLQLAIAVRRSKQLGAVGEELRGAAFVGLDMRRVGTDHAVVGLAHGGECQRVGGSAVEDEIHVAFGLEQLAQAIAHLAGQRVVAVGRQPALVGCLQRIERFGQIPAKLSLANWVRQPGKVCFMGACGVRAGCGKP